MPADSRPAPVRLAQLATWLLGHVAARAHQIVLEEFGGPERRTDYAVLACVREYGPLSQSDVSRRTGIDRADLVGIMRRLEARGAIARTSDPDDRRRHAVAITRSGAAELRRLTRAAERAQARLLEPLTADERRSFLDALQRLAAHHTALHIPPAVAGSDEFGAGATSPPA